MYKSCKFSLIIVVNFLTGLTPTNTFNYTGRLHYNQCYIITHLFNVQEQQAVHKDQFIFKDSCTNQYVFIDSTSDFQELLKTKTPWAVHARDEHGITKGIVFNISHLIYIKVLDIYIKDQKVYSISLNPLINTAEFYTPSTYSNIKTTTFKNAIVIGHCGAAPLSQVFNRITNTNNFKKVYLQFTDNNARYNFTDIDISFVVIPLRLSAKTYNELNTTKFWDDLLYNTKQHINICIEHIKQCILIHNKPCFILGNITPTIYPQIDIKSGNKFKHTIERINQYTEECISDINSINLHFIDINDIASLVGKKMMLDDIINNSFHNNLMYKPITDYREQWFSEKGRFFSEKTHNSEHNTKFNVDNNFISHCSLHNYFGREDNLSVCCKMILNQVEHYLKIVNQTDIIKLIIFDLDNTLLRGSIAEDYVKLNTNTDANGDTYDRGAWERGMRETLSVLKARGVLLALCSKNNFNTVKENIQYTYLKDLDMFNIVKINYKSKVDNILEILQELSISAKSAVFIDDSALEREEVKYSIKDLRVPIYNRYALRHDLLYAAETQRLHATGSSVQNTYQNLLERNTLKASMNRDEYLKSLDICINFNKLQTQKSIELQRCFQLINKTNQFNTTGVRWSYQDFYTFLNNHEIYYFCAQDKLQDYGIIGVLMYNTTSNNIIQFIMSCRVIGLSIENNVLRWFVNYKQVSTINALLINTDLNEPCQYFYSKNNFILTTDNTWCVDDTSTIPNTSTHITSTQLNNF